MPQIAADNIRWRLKQIDNNTIYDVNTTDNFMVGRSPNAQIVLNSNKTSRVHSLFVVNVDGHLLVQDLKSVNGTFVNGTQIAVCLLHRVFPGDLIGFGIADIGLSETERDRQTFFVVLYNEPPPVRALTPPEDEEANLVDSTTDYQENLAGNSRDTNLSSGKNTTAELKHIPMFLIPESSSGKNESLEVIEISSSTCEAKSDIDDTDDCFLESPNLLNIHIANVFSVPVSPSDRKKVTPTNNWLHKAASPKKPTNNRRSDNFLEKRVGGPKRLTTTTQVAEFFGAPSTENRRHTTSEINDVNASHLIEENQNRPSSSGSRNMPCDTSKKKTDSKQSEKIQRKKIQQCPNKKEKNVSKEKMTENKKVSEERSSREVVNSERNVMESIVKSKEPAGKKSIAENPSWCHKDLAKTKSAKQDRSCKSEQKINEPLKTKGKCKDKTSDLDGIKNKDDVPQKSSNGTTKESNNKNEDRKEIDKRRKSRENNSTKRKSSCSDEDLLLQLDRAISGKDGLLPPRDQGVEVEKKKEKPTHVDKDNEKHNKKKKIAVKEKSVKKTVPSTDHKQVQIDDSDKLILNDHQNASINNTDDIGIDVEKNENANKLICRCNIAGTSKYQVECPVHNRNSTIKDATSKVQDIVEDNSGFKDPNVSLKSRKSLEKSFTKDKDNSVIIDITEDDDDDMDVSSSQIFHMSQIVKLEQHDYDYQQIKNELAEMDFCTEETIMNQVPINLEDMAGFENTQDICACLEDTIEDNQNDDNFISEGENEELRKILESDDISVNKDDVEKDNGVVEEMECEDESSISSKNIKNDSTTSEGDKSHTAIDCNSFFGKTKYLKPPVIGPHTIVKPNKGVPKKSPAKQRANVKIEEGFIGKRKNSLETPAIKKKLKASPKGVAERPCFDSKSIQNEFKKRNSGSKGDLDSSKLSIENIREERRKKLKEIGERSLPPSTKKTASESVGTKGKTVKVLPESKTRRGSFLCDQLNDRDTTKTRINNRNITNVNCKCNEPGGSVQRAECPVHKINPSNRNVKKENLPTRPKTPNKVLTKYQMEPLDVLEPSKFENYNLRRTKSSDDINRPQLRSSIQTRYNLRHGSSAHLENNVTDKLLKEKAKIDPRMGRHVLPQLPPQYPESSASRPPCVNQAPQYALPHHTYPMKPMPVATHQDPSRRLMWTNGGPARRPPVRRLPNVDDVYRKTTSWLPNWLTEQLDIDSSAPVNDPPATSIPPNFESHDQYYDAMHKFILLELWQYLYKGFREGSECQKVKIEHVRVANDLMTLDCISYITQKELRQGLFFKPDDFLVLECVVKDRNHSYMSLSFGIVQRCYKSTIFNNDLISVRLGDFCEGEPHTKVELSIVTRYQPDREINQKKFPIVKVLANVRPHLMLIRAIKGLAESPLCSKILHPKINEYRIAVTHRDIIQPHTLNAQQKSIVLEAASLCTGNSHGIYCIKGPPGTGKSTVIVNLVYQILLSNNTQDRPPMILLAAPSNTAVDSLLSKLKSAKHKLGQACDKYKTKIKCVRIGPVSSISKDLIGYSLPKLAEQHMPLKHAELPEFKAARDRNENMVEFARKFFGDRYGHEIKTCEDLIIEKSNIICTTLNSCINGKLIEAVNRGLIKFSCCIIDEATQCHEVEALLPTVLGIDKLVLVGDPKQLNATIMNRDAQKLGFGASLFSRISSNFPNDPRSPIKMLTDQYRMHPEICAFPNKHFYEGKLRSFPRPVNKLPDNIRPYLVFNCEKINDSADYTNIDEVHLINKLLRTIFDMIERTHKYTVGIISPYNAQKDLINSNIAELVSKNTNCRITVNTVDSFQGSENDIIIISCVRDSTNSFLQNENRLNVALTRAKQALYIIGNYTLFKECRPLYDLREDAKNRRLLLDIRQNPLTISNFKKYLLTTSQD